MSIPQLPAEILDHIIDHLHDTAVALRNCCLVSKSWIPRTRKHLFADVEFSNPECLQSWKEAFPDSSTSPACYAKTLYVGCSEVVTAADAQAGGWITGFSCVLCLEVGSPADLVSFVPFHGFSPVIKSLRVTIFALVSPHIFNLILSFPLLEDLAVTIDHGTSSDNDDSSIWMPLAVQSSSAPILTGSLELLLWGGMKHITHWLLSLPGGIRFRKFIWRWSHQEDLSLMMALVERCSHTLESLDISCRPSGKTIHQLSPAQDNSKLVLGGSWSTSVDLSRAINLKDVLFRCKGLDPEWIAMALRTVTPDQHHLQQISLYAPGHLPRRTFRGDPAHGKDAVGESNYRQWLELDHLLVQLWESHSICLKVSYYAPSGKEGEVASTCVYSLLPEVTSRGIADFVRREWR
jgi:hypothetical protein